MRGSRPKTRRLQTAALAAVLCMAASAFGADDAGSRHWNMKAASPGRTSRVTCEPIRRQPVEAWRMKPENPLRCDPVIWDGTIFALTSDAEGRNVLLGIDAATGDVKARKVILGSTDDIVSLLAWQGTIVMTERAMLRGFLFKGTSFKPMWKKKGTFWRDPALCRDILFVNSGSIYQAYDVRRGRVIDVDVTGKGIAGTTIDEDGNGHLAAIAEDSRSDYYGRWLGPRIHVIEDLSKRTPTEGPSWGYGEYAAVFAGTGSPELGRALIARMESPSDGRAGWFIWCTTGFKGEKGTYKGLLLPERRYARGRRSYEDGGLADARVWPAIYNGRAYTFDSDWNLLSIDVEGRYRTVVERKDQPSGSWRGRPSVAQNVAYFGNWAVDLDTKRVLWVHKFKEKLDLPSFPAGDGRLLVRTKEDVLICLADPDIGKPATAGAEASAAGPTTVPPLPFAMDGVLLRDGTEVAGTVTRKDGQYVVTPRKGAPRTIAADDVLVARSDSRLLESTTDREIYDLLRRGARAEAVRAYEKLFDQALRMELPNEAGKILDHARPWGMSADRAKELSAKLTGKRMHPNADLRIPALARKRQEAETAAAKRIVTAAKWCKRRELGTAAAGLLAISLRLHDDGKSVQELAATTMPPSFPFRADPRAGLKWIAWAPYVLSAEAEFLAADDPAWQRVSGIWKRDTIGFRTPHMILFSRSSDADVIGPCLRSGEAAVNGLKALLDDGPVAMWDDADRLDVRIHANQKDYLAERTKGGGAAPTWSAGYYSPATNVSRFFVPDPQSTHEPLGRGLFKVLAHELTHHYVDARWIPSFGTPTDRSVTKPGFWIVEGLARFIEDQMVDADTRGLTYDDETVESIDAAAQVARSGNLFRVGSLIDLTQLQFAGLSDSKTCDVTLRRSLVTYEMTPRSIFYEQSGALVFWLLQRGGENTRAATIRYVRDFYTGKSKAAGWKQLGFDSATELEASFLRFLRSIR